MADILTFLIISCILVLSSFIIFFIVIFRKNKKRSNIISVNGKNYTTDFSKVNVDKLDEFEKDIEKKLINIKAKNRTWELNNSYLSEIWNNATACEESGDVDAAIRYWEQSVEFAISVKFSFTQYAHGLDRLMILYRKKREYDKEISICEYCISSDPVEKRVEKYKTRLERAKQLKEKRK